jgi:hypothetical protein
MPVALRRGPPTLAPPDPTHAAKAVFHYPLGRKRLPMAPMRALPMEPGPDQESRDWRWGALTEYFGWHFLPRSRLVGGSCQRRFRLKSRPNLCDHLSLERPRSSREALPDSGCRPPRWRFSVRHSRDGCYGVPRRSARHCAQRWRLVLGVHKEAADKKGGSRLFFGFRANRDFEAGEQDLEGRFSL